VAPATAADRLRRFAWLLDELFRIPGTKQRVGLDALIGLVPGVGDTIGALLSTYIILEAARRGASIWTVTRMLANVGVETVVGAIPLLGDLFDVVFKANRRNMALLGDTLEREAPPRDPTGVLRLASVLIVAIVVAMLAAAMALTVAVYRMIFG
jgi:hypothetical protein